MDGKNNIKDIENIKVIIDKKGRRYINKGEDFFTKSGVIKKEDILTKKVVKSSKGETFVVTNTNFYDYFTKIKRGPQIISPKDLGYVIARTGLNKNSIVVEAGSGSGAATIIFASIGKKVYSYEIREEHLKLAKKNVSKFNLENVEFFNKDVENFIHEDINLLFLDLPNPIKVLDSKFKGLKNGSFIVSYLPTISQVERLRDFCESKKEKFFIEEVSEILKREWNYEKNKVRPKTEMLGHTAFLVFIRYLGD